MVSDFWTGFVFGITACLISLFATALVYARGTNKR
jgi:hypothetical protein